MLSRFTMMKNSGTTSKIKSNGFHLPTLRPWCTDSGRECVGALMLMEQLKQHVKHARHNNAWAIIAIIAQNVARE